MRIQWSWPFELFHWNFCKRTRRVCVCIVLVHFGRYSQEVNGKSVKLAVWAVSLNFLHDFTLFVVDIHQIRLISLFRHFSDHIHSHGSAGLVPKLILTPCHIGIFSLIFINNIHLQAAGGMGSVAWPTSLGNTWKQGGKMVGNKSTIIMVETEAILRTVGRRRRWNLSLVTRD